MNIIHYSYDSIKNPYCAGGGAYRSLMVHKLLPPEYNVTFYSGKFKGAKAYEENDIYFKYIGLGINYLIGRMSFALMASFHSLFVKTDLIVIEFSAYSPVLTFLFKPKKTIIQFHHFQGKDSLRKYSFIGFFPWLAEEMALRLSKNIITPAESTAKLIKLKYGEHKNILVGYNGFDESLLRKNKSEEKYILSLGRIDIYMKGLDILVPAFERIAPSFPEYKLIIAGHGTDKDIKWLSDRITSSCFKNQIQLILDVSSEKKKKLLSRATFVCISSRFEGWCIVAIEAAASSKATLGTLINGLCDSIKNNETGILIPCEDIQALSEHMKILLSDKKLRETLGNAGYKWAQNYTWARVSEIQSNFYKFLINQKIDRK